MKLNSSALMPLIRALSRDIAGCCGVAMIVEGVRQIYPPAGLIVAGACVVYATVQFARRA